MFEFSRKYLRWPVLVLLICTAACKPAGMMHARVQEGTPVQVDSLIVPDADALALIAPYKATLDAEITRVLGNARYELAKGPVESALGNFVADLTEEKASQYAGIAVDMGAITIGGLRVPIAEGPIRLNDVFELMPFENMVWILELTPAQTRQLFAYAAARKNIAISSSKLLVANDEPLHIEINGQTLDPERKYTLAVSDYLANGGDDMNFLKEARVLQKLDVKLRDIIVEKVEEEEAAGRQIEARVEGRVQIKK
jgi:2',3'-cyclic-nucleotide 2'-phosphodiesterase (5'-nucleotidase family)